MSANRGALSWALGIIEAMRYALAFFVFGAFSAVGAARIGAWGWLLVWPGVSFFLVGMAYALGEPAVFGKRGDGGRAWWAAVLLGPYLALAWVVWRVQRWVSGERCADEIVPGVWVGRRPVCGEMPEGVGMVVDLTCEFAESAAVQNGREYVCVPMLDGVACDEGCLAEVVERVARYSGGVYIHCAQGHGRSAMLAAAVLVAKGYAKDVDEAVRMLVGRRAGVRLSAGQRGVVERIWLRIDAESGRDAV